MHSTEGSAVYNFQYANPTRVCFGEGQIAKLPELIPAGSRLLVLYGGGSIKQNGVYEQLTQALAGREWLEFPGIGANPQYDQLMEAVALVKRERIDFLLAVGGGSVVDGSKFVAAAACFEERIPGDPAAQGPHQGGVAAGLRADPAGHRLESSPAAVVSRREANSPS
jgi:NADP-dependent alcohol dehydrogenase